MMRAIFTPPWVAMADAELPSTWTGAARSALGNSLWMLPLVAIERLVAGEFEQAGALGVVWLLAIAAAVKLHVLQDIISSRERQRQLFTWALIVCGAAILGAGLYRLGAQQSPAPQEITKTEVVHDPPTAEDIAKATASLNAQNRQLQTALDGMTRQRDDLGRQNEVLRRAAPPGTVPPAPPVVPQRLTAYDLASRQRALDEFEDCLNDSASKAFNFARDLWGQWNENHSTLGINGWLAGIIEFRKLQANYLDAMATLTNKYRNKYPEIEQTGTLIDQKLIENTDLFLNELKRLKQVFGDDDRPILLMNNRFFEEWWSSANTFSNSIGEKRLAIDAMRKALDKAAPYEDSK
jgi:hypothetical protein